MMRQYALRFPFIYTPAILFIWLLVGGTTGLLAREPPPFTTGKIADEEPLKAEASRLEKQLKTADTKERIPILLELSELFSNYSQFSQNIRCAEEALKTITTVKITGKQIDTWKVRALFLKALGLSRMSKAPEALELLDKAEIRAHELGAETLAARIRLLKGDTYKTISQFERALTYYEKCRPHFEKTGNTNRLIDVYTEIGTMHMRVGDHNKALEYLLKGLYIAENSSYTDGLVTALNALGVTYHILSNMEKSRYYLERAWKIVKTRPPRLSSLSIPINLGGLIYQENDNDAALELYQKGLAMSEKLELKYFISFYLHQIGVHYRKTERLDKALAYCTDAMNMEKEIGNRRAYALSLALLGSIYAEKKNFKKGREFLDAALKIAGELKSKRDIKSMYFMFSTLYETKKDYKKSLEYHKLYYDMSYEMLNETTSKQVAEMQTRYETLKKEKKIQLLEKDNEMQRKNRNYLIAALFMAVILLALLVKRFIYLLSFWKSRKHIAHYRIMEEIGSGGVGIVYKAHSI
ncbi:MAG: tetratricopeptide repeat protein, partial [bacterium]|nr:tetratricopeptide repeat protein [bacterium]